MLSSGWTESWTSQKASIFQEWIKINPSTEQKTSPCTISVCIVQVHESVLLWKRWHNRDQYLQFVWHFQPDSFKFVFYLSFFWDFHHSQTSLIKTHIFTIIPCTGSVHVRWHMSTQYRESNDRVHESRKLRFASGKAPSRYAVPQIPKTFSTPCLHHPSRSQKRQRKGNQA